jgi:TRAP-type C4-dicarboxylate transport system permease small subunit
MRSRNLAFALERAVTQLATAIGAASLLALLGLAVVQIVLRNVAHVGLPWIDHVSRQLVLYVALLGAVTAAARNRHIRLDLFGRINPSFALRLERVFALGAAVVCALFAVAAWRFWWVEWQSAPPGTSRALVAAVLILPGGFALLALSYLLRALGVAERRP